MSIDKKYRVPKIVAAHQRTPAWLRVGLLLLVLAGVAGLAYQQGGNGIAEGLARLQSGGKDRVTRLEQQRNELKRELEMVRQAAEVDREALLAIKEQVKTMQSERLKMEEELAFLRGIVSTSSKKQVLRIQNFKLQQGLEAQQYVYKYTVSQVINSGSVVKGKIEMTVIGLKGEQTVNLQLKQLSEEKLESHKMRFRYFQNVEGKLRIPPDFQPAKVKIEVKPTGSKLAPVDAAFEWSPVS
ncbi:MAG: hypothetical protein KUF74_00680 [Candidatus Thiodiazotropha sp. (ex Ctena orbiculata)]|nr:hypothetical protein [Candidatus Thiodiazotropha taylori]